MEGWMNGPSCPDKPKALFAPHEEEGVGIFSSARYTRTNIFAFSKSYRGVLAIGPCRPRSGTRRETRICTKWGGTGPGTWCSNRCYHGAGRPHNNARPTTLFECGYQSDDLFDNYINPKDLLFFPHPSTHDPNSASSGDKEHHQKDALAFDLIKEKKWRWLDPDVAFYRTKSEDEIKEEWEEKKGELKRDWKRRAREAGKVSRRELVQ